MSTNATTDPLDGYPVSTNDSLKQVAYHLMRINQAFFLHVKHQEAIKDLPHSQYFIANVEYNLAALLKEVTSAAGIDADLSCTAENQKNPENDRGER